jgi:predicted aspartyl protease
VLAGCEQDQGCDFVKVAQVPLEPRGQVFVVPVTVNGHAINMMLDTGAERSLLTEAAVQRLNIRRSDRTFSVVVGASSGSLKSDAEIDSMSIGGVALPVDHIVVNSFGGNIDGMLGLDILGRYDLDIDGPNRTLVLYRVRRCEQAEPPWDGPAMPVAEISTRLGLMEMPLEIDGVSGTAAVDTGSSFTLIRLSMMQRLGLSDAAMASDQTAVAHTIAGKDVQGRVHKFHTIRIGPVTAHDVSILVLPSKPPAMAGGRQQPDGLVGQDLLRNRRVWFSLSTGRLYISRNQNDMAPEPALSR